MRVLVVTTSYPEARDGSEAAGGFVAEFAGRLAQHVSVSVVAASSGQSSTGSDGELQVFRFGVGRWPLSLLSPRRPTDWMPIYQTIRSGLEAVREAVRVNKPDYILALWALPSGYWARRMHDQFGIPYGVWALGSDIWSLGRIPILRTYLGSVLANAEHRFADGLRLGRDVELLSGRPCEFLPSSRQLHVREPSDPSSTAPYRLAFLGRWHPNKGIDIFLTALRQLAPDDWSRIEEVRIHGGGPMESEVQRQGAELRSLGYPVKVGGYLDANAAAEFLAWSDYVILPSRVESIPVVFSDAAQLRRPLVATPVGDLPDLFERHEFGVLADSPTAEAFAESLRQALRMPANRFRTQLDEVSAEFDVNRAAARLAERLGGSES